MPPAASSARSPAQDGFRMPAETSPHERTLMAWPCRAELWGPHLGAARDEYAGVANSVAAFEPVTMVVADAEAAAEARARLTVRVEVVTLPLDDSWMRDNGAIFVLDDAGRRAGVHFRFNAWGEKFAGWDRDEAAGGVLAGTYGDLTYEVPIVLEGGSILIDAGGRLVTTEQCLLSPNRNPHLDRAAIEAALCSNLGATEVVWLGRGLYDDRDTDGHVDGFAAFSDAGVLILQARPPGDPDHEAMAENHERAVAAGMQVVDFTPMARADVGDVSVALPYLNLYLCNGAAIVPLAGGAAAKTDEEALAILRSLLPGREVVGVPGLVISYGGGGPHCITQQVPARRGATCD
ncbi:MAG: agmatine/peptidylarginine deiminase [Acidimicrobiales bacterium]